MERRGRQDHQHRLLGQLPGPWTVPAYTAAKHGVAGLTKALSNEWARKNIHVNAIAPGYFDTEICAAIVQDPVREPQIRGRIPGAARASPKTWWPAVVSGQRRQQLRGRARAGGGRRLDGEVRGWGFRGIWDLGI